jgi:sporulation protein YlmC with PRC-barrel domain
MKRQRFNAFQKMGLALLIASTSGPGAWSVANGQERVPNNSNNAVKAEGANVGQLDTNMVGANIRASKLIGMNIYNTQGESLGQIKDIVIDANTGVVRYAAVTYGGFLGVGNKMFAVPFEAFKSRPSPTDKNRHVLTLDVDQKTLQGAEGFDENLWPNLADEKFTQELDRRYKVERRPKEVRVQVDRDGVRINNINNDNIRK